MSTFTASLLRLVAIIVLFFAAGSCALGKGGPTAQFAFRCPESPGICMWNAEGWSKINSAEIFEHTRAIAMIGDNLALVLTRGHQDEGAVFLFDVDGNLRLRRDLFAARALRDIFGMTGDLGVLCNSDHKSSLCDLWFSSSSLLAGGAMVDYSFPRDCLYPRFHDDGRALCLIAGKERYELRYQENAGSVFGRPHRLPHEIEYPVQDLQPIDSERLAILSDSRVFVYSMAANTAFEVASQWVTRFHVMELDLLYFRCAYTSSGDVDFCQLNRQLVEGGEPEELWRSESLVPAESYLTEGGQLVFDVYSRTRREIISVDLVRKEVEEEVLWSGGLWWEPSE